MQIRELDRDSTQTLQVSSDKKYLWDGVEIAEERDATGGTVVKRFYRQGFVDSDGTVLYYTKDHLGSIRELTDLAQTIRARYAYDPYGRMTKIGGDRDNFFAYTGHPWHAQSGLFLAQYRAYDASIGRWLSRDPIHENGGNNLYLYVFNDPVSLNDSFGLDAGQTCIKEKHTYPSPDPLPLPPGWHLGLDGVPIPPSLKPYDPALDNSEQVKNHLRNEIEKERARDVLLDLIGASDWRDPENPRIPRTTNPLSFNERASRNHGQGARDVLRNLNGRPLPMR